MDGEICPYPQKSFTFEKSENYTVRIDYAKIRYSPIGQNWVIKEIGNAGKSIVNYHMEIPEPSQSIFNAIYNNILAKIRSWICQIFPFLGFCS